MTLLELTEQINLSKCNPIRIYLKYQDNVANDIVIRYQGDFDPACPTMFDNFNVSEIFTVPSIKYESDEKLNVTYDLNVSSHLCVVIEIPEVEDGSSKV